MRSKTSFFNKTIYRKNLTRFAPVWVLYTLCLVMGVALMYTNGGTLKQFHFARNYIQDMFSIMGVVNLGYALLVAQLLFGDLYNSRMCNMLHAFPVSRESWFVTNILSGLTFSVVPTAAMMVVAAPLLMLSIFENAVVLAPLVFLAANLEFLCFFGMAAFAAMCTANRFTMAAGYGLLNAGAMIAYWLVDTVYTPMLYGVITPVALMWNLTPAYHMCGRSFAETRANLYDLRKLYGEQLEGAVLEFTVTDQWWHLFLVAGVGIVFALLALVLYKRRDLECAGDAVAFRALVPVFEVLCAIFVATAVQYSLENLLYIQNLSRWVLFLGLIVGWFIAKMLVEHTTRVFRATNFTGLALLAAVFGISLTLTHFDMFGIEDYIPEATKIKQVTFGTSWTSNRNMDSTEDIEALLRLHEGALENRAEEGSGTYLKGDDGSWVKYNHDAGYAEDNTTPFTHVAEVCLTYELNDGKLIKRRYNVWVDSEAGRIANDYLNQWEELNPVHVLEDGTESTRLEIALENFENFNVGYADGELPEICYDKEAALELLNCIERDRQEGRMARHPFFHIGFFRVEDEYSEKGYYDTESVGFSIASRKASWHIDIYPDAVHTVRWLQSHDLLDWEVQEGTCIYW